MIYSSVELYSIYEDLNFGITSVGTLWVTLSFADTKVLNHVSNWLYRLTGKCRKKNWTILLTDELIPHAGLYFCTFGPWQLLYCPMLWRHSRRFCFIYICLSKSFRRKLQTFVSAKDKVTQCYSKLCVVMLKFNYFNLLWICCTPCVQQQIKSL